MLSDHNKTPANTGLPRCESQAIDARRERFGGEVESPLSGGEGVFGDKERAAPEGVKRSSRGARIAILSAATNFVADAPAASFRSTDWCGQGAPLETRSVQIPSEPIALSYAPGGRLYVQSREPSTLWMWRWDFSSGLRLSLRWLV